LLRGAREVAAARGSFEDEQRIRARQFFAKVGHDLMLCLVQQFGNCRQTGRSLYFPQRRLPEQDGTKRTNDRKQVFRSDRQRNVMARAWPSTTFHSTRATAWPF